MNNSLLIWCLLLKTEQNAMNQCSLSPRKGDEKSLYLTGFK